MDTKSLDLLKEKHLSNVAKLAKLDAAILAANQSIVQSEKAKIGIVEENVHIEFCLNLIDGSYKQNVKPILQATTEGKKPSIRVQLNSLFVEGEHLTVAQAHEKAGALGVDTTRGTINSIMHDMVKKGELEKVSLGVYKKAHKGESPASTGLSGVTEFERSLL